MKILVAHPGSQHARYLVAALLERGHDVRYATSLAFGSGSHWEKYIPSSLFNKRLIKNIPDRIIERHALVEPVPSVFQKMGVNVQMAYAIRNRMFQKSITARHIRSFDAVIGFDTSSKILATKCKQEGVPFFLELTTVHPSEKMKWLEFIRQHYPQWPVDELKKSPDLIKGEEDEIALATAVSTTAGYVKQTYVENAGITKDISINPLGADVSSFHPKSVYNDRPVFLFLGTLNAAKGLPFLLDAWNVADIDADLIVGGYGDWPRSVAVPARVKIAGRIAREDRERFFHSGDIFISPSLYEGFGLVQLEAAACGLAVLATTNSAGPEVLNDGEEGFFVRAGDVTALANKLNLLANDKVLRESIGRKAAIKAQSITWLLYGDRWISFIERTVKQTM